jgi:UDP-N-acetylglucosamine/UDP-N-acetyl-alpha-D-glucosaminouronate 4-epimerase
MTQVLITGGGGFIGSHLAAELLQRGHRVRVLDNFATGRRENLRALAGELEVIEGDIQSYERVHTAVAGCDVVFHQAALPSVPRSVQDPLTSNATNTTGTLNVLLAARDHAVRRVVCASSSSVYGAASELPKREDGPALPISPYAITKLAGEGYARFMHRVHGLDTVALRYFNVFGPRQDPTSQYAAVVPSFIGALVGRRRPVIFGDGEQSRDFTYVANAVHANVLAMDAPDVGGREYNIACGERVSVNRLLAELRGLLGCDIEPVYAPARPADVVHTLADLSRAQAELAYEPLVMLREGLERTVQHFHEEERWGLAGAGLSSPQCPRSTDQIS